MVNGRRIIITGASNGIGRALAIEFLKDRDNQVFLISRDNKRLQEIFENAPNKENIVILPFDLNTVNYDFLIESIVQRAGKVDILINNAATLVNKPFEKIKEEDFDSVISTNFKSPFFLIKNLIPYFSEKAHIVNIGSMGGVQGSDKFSGLSLYSSSKGALSILTECLAVELKDKGISVNCLALGSVQTSMFEQAFAGAKAGTTSESIAEYIAWFSINGHKWMNGKIIPVSIATP